MKNAVMIIVCYYCVILTVQTSHCLLSIVQKGNVLKVTGLFQISYISAFFQNYADNFWATFVL